MNVPSCSDLNVSHETFQRLAIYVQLIEKWTPRINLVSRRSVPEIWKRHIADSLQLWDAAPEFRLWADLGSGGGLPAMVVAIQAAERAPDASVVMVESDQRKAVFLRTAIRETGVNARVETARAEVLAPLNADVVSARALADLGVLCSLTARHLANGGTALFPKGGTWENEVSTARREWQFDCESLTSKTEPQAAILRIQGVSRV
ncbi:MAG: 16S rRNA (guanine(527)-N(7))-methyltransferase RsmG [Rhodobacteraceae bacterium]|nr:16S rRNA (guanine(527)-N(7))-methyltransferase RsmG [Paracoccaceae bacterium]